MIDIGALSFYDEKKKEWMAEPGVFEAPAGASSRDIQWYEPHVHTTEYRRGVVLEMDGSPALALGFANFPMERFGVQKTELKALTRTPVLPSPEPASAATFVK
jgi:hypothetical protein